MKQELEEAKNRGFWDMVGSGLKQIAKASLKVVTAPARLVVALVKEMEKA